MKEGRTNGQLVLFSLLLMVFVVAGTGIGTVTAVFAVDGTVVAIVIPCRTSVPVLVVLVSILILMLIIVLIVFVLYLVIGPRGQPQRIARMRRHPVSRQLLQLRLQHVSIAIAVGIVLDVGGIKGTTVPANGRF